AEGAPADLTMLAPDAEVTICQETFRSKGRNTPFDGWTLRGAVAATIAGGRDVYVNDNGLGRASLAGAGVPERRAGSRTRPTIYGLRSSGVGARPGADRPALSEGRRPRNRRVHRGRPGVRACGVGDGVGRVRLRGARRSPCRVRPELRSGSRRA